MTRLGIHTRLCDKIGIRHTQVINAGEAVTIPKEWTGIWDTEGFTQIWVIYSEDGSGLE